MQILLITKMIKINANIGNLTIINGKVIRGSKADKAYNFDERKVVQAEDFDKILIDASFADVNIVPEDCSKVDVHLYGTINTKGMIEFDVHTEEKELEINLKSTGSYVKGNLKIDIVVPYKTFKRISVSTSSGNVTIGKGVLVKKFKVNTMSGDIKALLTALKTLANTMSGDVNLCIEALEDVEISISTMSGDVTTLLNNIGKLNVSINSMSGNFTNLHKGKDGYTADVEISTMSGDIEIMDYHK